MYPPALHREMAPCNPLPRWRRGNGGPRSLRIDPAAVGGEPPPCGCPGRARRTPLILSPSKGRSWRARRTTTLRPPRTLVVPAPEPEPRGGGRATLPPLPGGEAAAARRVRARGHGGRQPPKETPKGGRVGGPAQGRTVGKPLDRLHLPHVPSAPSPNILPPYPTPMPTHARPHTPIRRSCEGKACPCLCRHAVTPRCFPLSVSGRAFVSPHPKLHRVDPATAAPKKTRAAKRIDSIQIAPPPSVVG